MADIVEFEGKFVTRGKRKVFIMSKTFHKDHLKKSHVGKGQYDANMVSADLRAMADEVEKGNIVLVTRRIADMDESSDGSKMPAQLASLEWKFPKGKPAPANP